MKPWRPTLLMLTGATLIIGGCTFGATPAATPSGPQSDPAASISPLATPLAAAVAPESPLAAGGAAATPAAAEAAIPPTETPTEASMEGEATPIGEETMPADPNLAGIPGDLLNAVLDDAGQRLSVAPDALVVTRAEAVTWNDGSLGCPEPGMFYTQAVIDGYWIVVEGANQSLDYRAQGNGFFRVCERLGTGSRVQP